MKKRICKRYFFFLLGATCSFQILAQASFDSLKIKQPKHYFNTVIAIDAYRKPKKDLGSNKAIDKKLENYGVRQTMVTFHAPLYTKDRVLIDSTRQNAHLLLTGTLLSFRPSFAGIPDHNLIKFGIGLRYIYNTGKKGVWFIDVSPFMTKDASFDSKPYYRLASTFIYSHNPSSTFNWRLGITKSFLWGNRLYLPFVGFRFGALNKVNFTFQFPRYTSLNIPMGEHSYFSLYSMSQGGMYRFSNADTLYPKSNIAAFNFSRFDMNHGIRFDFRTWKHFSFYVALGFSTRNRLTFYSDNANKSRKAIAYNSYFYTTKAPASMYLNLGMVFRLGQVRSSFGVKNLNDATDLLNAPSGNLGNSLQPMNPKIQNKINLQSVQDLVDYSDF